MYNKRMYNITKTERSLNSLKVHLFIVSEAILHRSNLLCLQLKHLSVIQSSFPYRINNTALALIIFNNSVNYSCSALRITTLYSTKNNLLIHQGSEELIESTISRFIQNC